MISVKPLEYILSPGGFGYREGERKTKAKGEDGFDDLLQAKLREIREKENENQARSH